MPTTKEQERRKAYNARPDVKAKRLLYMARYKETLKGRLKQSLYAARSNAKKMGRECSITYDDLQALYDKQGGRCALTGWELSIRQGQKTTLSIDRIDNNKDYHINNIQLVVWQVNFAKNEWPIEDLITLCEAVLAHRS